jgi:hypothetical protein
MYLDVEVSRALIKEEVITEYPPGTWAGVPGAKRHKDATIRTDMADVYSKFTSL